MQFGLYSPFLKKNSYASNINRIVDHAISRKSEIDPDIIIIGTSIAYEGISVRLLNERLRSVNLKAQSIAIPSSELVVQQLALEKVLKVFKNVKFVIHLNEPETAWATGKVLSHPTLAMSGEFNRINVIDRFQKNDFDITIGNFSFILIRLWAYRQDLADLILSPLKRVKDFGKSQKRFSENLYTYENANQESLELYSFRNLEEALEETKGSAPPAQGSTQSHKDAIYKTCRVAKDTSVPLGETDSTRLFQKRLLSFYKSIREKDIKVINVFPPLPNYLVQFHHAERIEFWKKNYAAALSEKIFDLADSIPKERNASYYYDILHLNEKGMKLFTVKLADSIIAYTLELNRLDK